MKKIFLTFAVAGLFLFGCSDVGVNPNVPANSSSTNTTLSKKGSSHSNSPFSVTETINGEVGGTITLNQIKKSEFVSASVFFPPHSFSGTQTITMTVDPSSASVTFYPHIVFNNRVDFNLTFLGLDLKNLGLTSGKVDFYFEADDGSLTLVKNNGVSVDIKLGLLAVKNAGLYHFSRYIFAK